MDVFYREFSGYELPTIFFIDSILLLDVFNLLSNQSTFVSQKTILRPNSIIVQMLYSLNLYKLLKLSWNTLSTQCTNVRTNLCKIQIYSTFFKSQVCVFIEIYCMYTYALVWKKNCLFDKCSCITCVIRMSDRKYRKWMYWK